MPLSRRLNAFALVALLLPCLLVAERTSAAQAHLNPGGPKNLTETTKEQFTAEWTAEDEAAYRAKRARIVANLGTEATTADLQAAKKAMGQLPAGYKELAWGFDRYTTTSILEAKFPDAHKVHGPGELAVLRGKDDEGDDILIKIEVAEGEIYFEDRADDTNFCRATFEDNKLVRLEKGTPYSPLGDPYKAHDKVLATLAKVYGKPTTKKVKDEYSGVKRRQISWRDKKTNIWVGDVSYANMPYDFQVVEGHVNGIIVYESIAAIDAKAAAKKAAEAAERNEQRRRDEETKREDARIRKDEAERLNKRIRDLE